MRLVLSIIYTSLNDTDHTNQVISVVPKREGWKMSRQRVKGKRESRLKRWG